MFKGYLTYTLAALTAIGAVAGFVSGVITTEQALTMIWGALAVFGIRRAIG